MRRNLEGDNANGRLPIFLRMSGVRGRVEAQARRLLRLLLLRRRILSADSRRAVRLLRDQTLSLVLWRGCGCRRQRLDDPAIRNRTAATLIDHAVEFATQGAQVDNLSINLGPVRFGDCIDSVAGAITLVGQVEQCAHLVERKPKISRAPDEAQPIGVLWTIGPVVSRRAARRGKQSNPLIIADCLNLGIRPSPQLADREEIACHSLDPIVTTGSIWVVMSNLSR